MGADIVVPFNPIDTASLVSSSSGALSVADIVPEERLEEVLGTAKLGGKIDEAGKLPSYVFCGPNRFWSWGPTLRYNAFLNSKANIEEYVKKLMSGVRTLQVLDTPISADGRVVSVPATFIPGHTSVGAYGPVKSDVMVLSKFPWTDETAAGRNFVGPSGQLWKRECDSRQLIFDSWYITNLCKIKPLWGGKTISAALLREFVPLLMYELSIVRPRVIICMGTDAVKILVPGRGIKAVRGGILDYVWDVGEGAEEVSVEPFTSKLVATAHPAKVLMMASEMQGFSADMDLVRRVVLDVDTPQSSDSAELRYQVIDTFEELSKWVEWMIYHDNKELSIDCEWSGRHPKWHGKDNYLRSIQISWEEKHAVYLKCVDAEGRKFLLAKGKYVLGEYLKPLFDRQGVSFIGHNIRADAPWLLDLGLSEEAVYTAIDNGFDTMLASHVLNEDSDHSLNGMATSLTNLGRYDYELSSWIKENKTKRDVEGFKRVPDELLEPYAMRDADATFRLKNIFKAELEEQHRLSRRQYGEKSATTLKTLYDDIEMAAVLPIMAMEANGVRVDMERLEQLTNIYSAARSKLISQLKKDMRWPEFNFRSIDHKREFLFSGVPYKDKKKPKAPPDALKANCQPIKDTGKGHGTLWADIIRNGESMLHNPSTDANTLSELALSCDNPAIKKLHDLNIIDTICKNVLRAPEPNKETGELEYNKGLRARIYPDCKLHTSLSQLTETGRYTSSNPNMQNLPARQQGKLTSILEECGYVGVPAVRSCIVASPGWVLVHADYKAAELMTMAFYSKDKKMMEALMDPLRDLHMETANEMLQLGLNLQGISKKEMKAIKDAHKAERTQAKAINFGIPYGLGASGLSADLRAQNVPTTKEECEELLRVHAKTYPQLHAFLDGVASKVTSAEGFFQTVWGRRRRFYSDNVDDSVIARQKRQAKNFPIQSVVADALTVALIRFWRYKRRHGISDYRLVLPIHDAIMFEVRPAFVRTFVENILEQEMCFEIPGLGTSLKIDSDIWLRWGEKPSRESLLKAGLPEKDLELVDIAKDA